MNFTFFYIDLCDVVIGANSRAKREELEVYEISSSDNEGDDDDDIVLISESDDNRRRMLREAMDDDELESMRQFRRDFLAEASPSQASSKGKGKERETPAPDPPLERNRTPSLTSKSSMKISAEKQVPFSLKTMVKDEMVQRRKESLGMGEARKLGGHPDGVAPLRGDPRSNPRSLHPPASVARGGCGTSADSSEGESWICLVCTL